MLKPTSIVQAGQAELVYHIPIISNRLLDLIAFAVLIQGLILDR